MKYFTRELLARAASDNDAIADATDADWENRINQYRAEWQQLKNGPHRPPEGTLKIAEEINLHDAAIITIYGRDRYFTILVQRDFPGGGAVELTYRLAVRPVVHRHPQSAADGRHVLWLYDEFEVASPGPPAVFKHSILLSHGIELEVSFTDLQVQVFPTVVSPENLSSPMANAETALAGFVLS